MTGCTVIRLGLPKGRMQESVFQLLADAGIRVRDAGRGYRTELSLPGFETKILKPQNIVEMLHLGSRDVGFAGADWVAELGADVVELLDTGLDSVRLVAAAPSTLLTGGRLPERPLIVASEYERIAAAWVERRGLDAKVVRSYGATEVFPPEDADCIVDNTATGSTLRSNGLEIVDELMTSSTRLYANPRALDDGPRAEALRRFVVLLTSVLEARRRVMLEVNVQPSCLEAVVAMLPCMRQPTVAPLHGNSGFAVKAAVPRADLPRLIPEIKARGGSDIVVTELAQIVP
ncbi:MAG TPA: ATP phosphoribosyltransferase [Candidatus Eisenbacteria bacterium]|nr:ATP phosphoribosyltransferase [Candidatus Eisenbacteria bacterium]